MRDKETLVTTTTVVATDRERKRREREREAKMIATIFTTITIFDRSSSSTTSIVDLKEQRSEGEGGGWGRGGRGRGGRRWILERLPGLGSLSISPLCPQQSKHLTKTCSFRRNSSHPTYFVQHLRISVFPLCFISGCDETEIFWVFRSKRHNFLFLGERTLSYSSTSSASYWSLTQSCP